ncbi:MAG: adenine deaminase [Syntrophobacterales bacterium]|jgi:adenine deaminase|nr:adenine deaminase [Syntrophobacterales bacterium]
MRMERLQQRLRAARGEVPSDLVLTGARVANVYTGEWLDTEVALFDGIIVGLGDYPGPRLPLPGRYLLPGLIDGHLHLESSMLTPRELARALLPLGTTTVVADPHEIANVWGTAGLDYLLSAAEGLPVDFFFMLPSCVPATSLETSGAILSAEALRPYRDHPRVLGLAEVMNFPGLVAGDPDLLAKLALFPQGPLDGHAPLLSGRALNAYRLAGIGSDHECTTVSEAQEKLRLGFSLMVREGSLAKNLADLLPAVTPASLRRAMLVTDDSHPEDLARSGHLNHLLREAVSLGLSPLAALTMATLNPAEYFRLRDRGAVAPGLAADLLVVEDLTEFRLDKVFKNGRLRVDQGRLLSEPETSPPPVPASALHVQGLDLEAFSPPAGGDVVKVIGLIPGQLLTDKRLLPTPVREGRLAADPGRDLLKLAVVERHHGTGHVGLGLVQGFGLPRGALASSVAHDSHNIVVVGADEADMLQAVRHLVDLGGGMAVVAGGQVLADLALPIAGLMSPLPLDQVAAAYSRLKAAYHELGGSLPDPFMALSFLALPVIPALKLTDLGLVDVDRFQVVPLWGEI